MQHHKLSLILNIFIFIFNIIKADELSIVSSSQSPQTFIQGDVGKNIFCTSNVNADSCVWRKGDFKCAFTNQGTGQWFLNLFYKITLFASKIISFS